MALKVIGEKENAARGGRNRSAVNIDVIVRTENHKAGKREAVSLSKAAVKRMGNPSHIKFAVDGKNSRRIYLLERTENDKKAFKLSCTGNNARYVVSVRNVPILGQFHGDHSLKYSEEEGHWFFDAEACGNGPQREGGPAAALENKTNPKTWRTVIHFPDFSTYTEFKNRATILGMKDGEFVCKLLSDYVERISK